MGATLRSEIIKLTSTKLWWILAAAMAAYVAAIGAFFAYSVTIEVDGQPQMSGLEAAKSVYGLLNPLGYAFPLVIGSLLLTTEFRHRTLPQTFILQPRRGRVLAAKMLVSIGVGLFYGIAAVVGILIGGALVLSLAGEGAFLGDGEVLGILARSVLAVVLWTLIGTAFAMVLTNQVAVIVVIILFTQFVEPIARVALAAFDSLSGVARYLPSAAADGLVGQSFFGASVDLLPQWAGALVMLGYVALFALIGVVTTFRRDVH